MALILRTVPTYFAGNAAANLIQNQGVAVFIGFSDWLTVRRDVKN